MEQIQFNVMRILTEKLQDFWQFSLLDSNQSTWPPSGILLNSILFLDHNRFPFHIVLEQNDTISHFQKKRKLVFIDNL